MGLVGDCIGAQKKKKQKTKRGSVRGKNEKSGSLWLLDYTMMDTSRRERAREKEGWQAAGNVSASGDGGVTDSHKSIPARFRFSSWNDRYPPVSPIQSSMKRYLEQYILEVIRYPFTRWNGQYQPVRYSIDSLAPNSIESSRKS